jgi:hypothetical protein
MRLPGLSLAVGSFFAFSSLSHATVAVVHDTLPTGISEFDAKVVAAGATVYTDTWDDIRLPALRGGYDVEYSNGILERESDDLRTDARYMDLTGRVMLVQPIFLENTPESAKASGLTFTFAEPINAFGLEIAHWKLCCSPSGIYLSFDDGDPIRLALFDEPGAIDFADRPSTAVFAGAVSDFEQFSTVNFWGDGLSDLFYVGGTIRFGSFDGNDPTPSPVPLPASVWFLGTVVGGLAGLRKLRPKIRSL